MHHLAQAVSAYCALSLVMQPERDSEPLPPELDPLLRSQPASSSAPSPCSSEAALYSAREQVLQLPLQQQQVAMLACKSAS